MKYSETTIGSTNYRLIRLDPIKAGRVATRAASILAAAADDAEAITALIDAYRKRPAPTEGADAVAKLANVPDLLAAMAGGVAKIDSDALYDLALTCVRGNLLADRKLNTDDDINEHFDDEATRDNLLPVLGWALKENCAGFFGKLVRG